MTKKFKYTPLLHIIFWVLYMFSPQIFLRGKVDIDEIMILRHVISTIGLIIIFYQNHFWLVKKYLTKTGMKYFVIINFLAISVLCSINLLVRNQTQHQLEENRMERIQEEQREMGYNIKLDPKKKEAIIQKKCKTKSELNPRNIFYYVLTCICIIGVSIALQSVENIYILEEKRKDEQRARTEAELKNLKSQLNPHFLFNTLNNIYALIAISQEKSQEAVMDLSKMLRYVLYESEAKELPISKEINFINNYVKLMKLRLSNKVEVNIHTDVTQNPNVNVAPLLFITFIENAFKHGISTQGKSFINFSIVTTSPTSVECKLENSYFPKSEEHDKSGSGIGMENLKRRLELIYPNRHTFTYGVEDDTYKSLLTINCSENV